MTGRRAFLTGAGVGAVAWMALAAAGAAWWLRFGRVQHRAPRVLYGYPVQGVSR